MAATPQKSNVPIATIGGEPGGRAAIVVDAPVAPPPPAEVHTSIVLGKAEPGRDIFAGEPVKDIQSSHALKPPADAPPEIEKDISSVLTFSSMSAVSSMQSEKDASGVAVGSSSAVTTDSTAQASTSPSSSQVNSAEASTHVDDVQSSPLPEGPLLEAEAEAARAAKELYPEVQK